MSMPDRLSEDFYYPDCPECEKPGWAAVRKARSDLGWEWLCEDCGNRFNSQPGTVWEGVLDLPDGQQRAYIDVQIRGLSLAEVSGGPRTKTDVSVDLMNAEKALKQTRKYGEVVA